MSGIEPRDEDAIEREREELEEMGVDPLVAEEAAEMDNGDGTEIVVAGLFGPDGVEEDVLDASIGVV